MVTTAADTTTAPASHDGRPVAKYVVIALGVLIAVAGLAATFLPRARPDIAYRVISVDLSRSDQVTVTFEVDKPPLATAECKVAAFNDESPTNDRRQAWRLNGVVVGPSRDNSRVSLHTVVVPTTSQATSAAVAECAITRDR